MTTTPTTDGGAGGSGSSPGSEKTRVGGKKKNGGGGGDGLETRANPTAHSAYAASAASLDWSSNNGQDEDLMAMDVDDVEQGRKGGH